METLSLILSLLLVIAIVLTQLNYRIALCLFPDSVKVTKFQGFLAWYGWLNLFVSLPFLWDGDVKQGLYPLLIGLIPTLVSIYFVFTANSSKNISFKKDVKVYLNSDDKLVEPGNDIYGFLDNYATRIRMVGLKLYFKELFAREKANKVLADGLLENDVDDTIEVLKTLSWIGGNSGVTPESQYIFLLEYMVNRYDRKKLYDNFEVFSKKSISIAKKLGLSFDKIPYPLAKYIAQNDCLITTATQNKSDFVMEVDGYVCDEDENIIAVFSQNSYRISKDIAPIIKRIVAKYYKLISKDSGIIIITNKKIIIKTQTNEKTIPLSSEIYSIGDDASFDNEEFFLLENISYLKFVLQVLNKQL